MTDTTQGAPAALNRSSIDLSLELERQLESESLPGSPAFPSDPHAHDEEHRTSLDPHILAHIVTQLRDSLTRITQERDDLVQQLAESHSREAEFKDSLTLCTERCASLEKDLENLRRKSQDDEEAISMLRSKVEESRRGLMRLQSERNAENKRMTLDLTNARTPSFGAPRSSQRASFTPLTGSGHPGPPSSFRRSTNGDNDPGFAEFVAGLPGSPGGQTLVFNESAESNSAPVNRRRSMFGTVNRSSSQIEGRLSPSVIEVDSLKQELSVARAELEETRHELSESNEAREASETCVKALRDFIGQLGAGDSSVQNVRLPPLPSDSHVQDVEPEAKPKSSSWGLKLWRVDTGASSSPATSTASASHTSPTAGRKSMDSYRATGSDHDAISPSTAVPLRNKFGAFFTRGSSVSSTSHPPPQLHQDEPILNGSDVSSSTEERSEPTSPAAEKSQSVYVRDPVGGATKGGTGDTSGAEPHYIPQETGDVDTMKIVPL